MTPEPGFISEDAFRVPVGPVGQVQAVVPMLQFLGVLRRVFFNVVSLGRDLEDADLVVRMAVLGGRYRLWDAGIAEKQASADSLGRGSRSDPARAARQFWRMGNPGHWDSWAEFMEPPHYGVGNYADFVADAGVFSGRAEILEGARSRAWSAPWTRDLRPLRDRVVSGIYRDAFMLGAADASAAATLADEFEESGDARGLAAALREVASDLGRVPSAMASIWGDPW